MSSQYRDFLEAAKLLGSELFAASQVKVLTGAYVIPENSPTLQILDSGGSARNVDLPAVTNCAGKIFIFVAPNATGALTVRLAGGGATVVTVAVGKMGIAVCANGTWYGGTLG
jgi:hypothetical protein